MPDPRSGVPAVARFSRRGGLHCGSPLPRLQGFFPCNNGGNSVYFKLIRSCARSRCPGKQRLPVSAIRYSGGERPPPECAVYSVRTARLMTGRSCATRVREPCQAGNRAALNGVFRVPRERRPRGFRFPATCVRRFQRRPAGARRRPDLFLICIAFMFARCSAKKR